MYYIRTKKNKYDVDVIIDVTTDSTYKNHTSLEWKDADIAAPGPQVGNYWYDGKSIALDSSDYSLIEKIIDDIETPLIASRDPEPAIPDAPDVVDPELTLFPGVGASALREELAIKEQMDTARAVGKSIAADRDPLKTFEPNQLVSDQPNYNRVSKELSNIKVMVAGFSTTTNYTLNVASKETEFTTVTFNPPLTFVGEKDENGDPVGLTTMNIPPGDDISGNIDDYIQYWSDLESKYQSVNDTMKGDLGL
mgnify:FL=1|tara:strand:+ start:6478 stop:7230 length:753 start_codon:yes stop_codon:yes gene_type:complete